MTRAADVDGGAWACKTTADTKFAPAGLPSRSSSIRLFFNKKHLSNERWFLFIQSQYLGMYN
ncbi:pilin [Acinetobacter haemolyticus]|uniref:pilin n=1 Tax=Acinetobacter haemolyticus TaxID=29430 RepID=UPI003D1EA395